MERWGLCSSVQYRSAEFLWSHYYLDECRGRHCSHLNRMTMTTGSDWASQVSSEASFQMPLSVPPLHRTLGPRLPRIKQDNLRQSVTSATWQLPAKSLKLTSCKTGPLLAISKAWDQMHLVSWKTRGEIRGICEGSASPYACQNSKWSSLVMQRNKLGLFPPSPPAEAFAFWDTSYWYTHESVSSMICDAYKEANLPVRDGYRKVMVSFFLLTTQ